MGQLLVTHSAELTPLLLAWSTEPDPWLRRGRKQPDTWPDQPTARFDAGAVSLEERSADAIAVLVDLRLGRRRIVPQRILVRHGFSSTGSQWSSRRCGVQDGVVAYTNTFIAVAEDCRAATVEVPRERAGGPTVASTQYTMLAAAPGQWTQEDVLLASSPQVRGRDIDEAELRGLRQEYFSQPRACLRASPLPKSVGWGLHYDAYGRITLHAVDSPEYAQLSSDASLTQLRAMLSSRAAS